MMMQEISGGGSGSDSKFRMTGHALCRLFLLSYNNCWRTIKYSRILPLPTTAVTSRYSTSGAAPPQSQKKGTYGAWGSKKVKPKVKVNLNSWTTMTNSAEVEEVLAPLRASVKEQGDLVRKLKDSGESEIDVKKAVLELKNRKKVLEDKELELTQKDDEFDRSRLEDLLKRRFFYDHSFAIYGGVTGQYDFGPMGCATKSNLLNYWRQFFVLEESMLEVDCSILTPEPVLKASGHVERFADLMVKDTETGECFRLDHLIKATLEKISKDKNTSSEVKSRIETVLSTLDGLTKDEMAALMEEFKILSPITGNSLTAPLEFNLMFSTSIGPTGLVKGFLRPETAQGIFVNFKRLLEFAHGKLPFAAAQIGNSFRNEISPRSGLLRVREFTMAEIEHFCDPCNLLHPKFDSVKDVQMILYSACDQMDGKPPSRITIGEAVKNNLVANETLGYFLVRIQQFMHNCGVHAEKLRFRQHMGNEMAHYARDCWDAECLTSYGWVECVGCADRSAYDLRQHTIATGVKLTAERKLPEPKTMSLLSATLNKATIGKLFKKDAKLIADFVTDLEQSDLEELQKKLTADGSVDLKIGEHSFKLGNGELSITRSEKTIHVEEFVPNVIEPSFGIGRILYTIFEHNFKTRPQAKKDDVLRTYISLPPIIAPVKCSVLPLSNKVEFGPKVTEVVHELRKYEISVKVDESSGASIGKRYARTDEIAIPFGITVDFETLKNSTVTLRERDSTLQVRMGIDEVGRTLRDLSNGSETWESVMQRFPKFESQDLA